MMAASAADDQMQVSTRPIDKSKRSAAPIDILFLLALPLIASLPFLSRLGFYYDDWKTLSIFLHQDLFHAVHELLATDASMRVRPGQMALLILEIKAFGTAPLGYHLAATLLLSVLCVCIYATMLLLNAERPLAFSLAVLFGLMPHFSTDRIWVSTQQSILCMIFALLGIGSLLRMLAPRAPRRKMWTAAAAVFFAMSVLSYEVAIGLIAIALAFTAWRSVASTGGSGQKLAPAFWGAAGIGLVLVAVFIAKAFHQSRVPLHDRSLVRFASHLPGFGAHALSQLLRFTCWTYGLHLPSLLRTMQRLAALSSMAWLTAIVISILVAVYLGQILECSPFPGRRICLRLLALSPVLFLLGYGLFFPSNLTDFTTAGIENRVAIASALAPACVLPCVLALACSFLRAGSMRNLVFAGAFGLTCGMNSLAMSGIAQFWVNATTAQKTVITSVQQHVPALPQGSTLLLDGFCRYRGPGIVFETYWDTTGAMQIALRDFTLRADVVSADLRFIEKAVDSYSYEDLEQTYPYGKDLFVFNLRNASLTTLQSAADAKAYLQSANPTGNGQCPASSDGNGVRLF